MNSRRRNIVIILIAAVAGLTSGFAFRWMQRGGTVSSQQPQASRVHSPAADNPRATPAATQRQKVSPFAAQLEQDLSMSSGVTRWLHWMTAIDPSTVKHVVEQLQWQWGNADPKGFADFLTSPAGQHAPTNSFSSAAREMARQNPEQALDWAARLPAEHRQLATSDVFREWQNSQPVAAMEWIRGLPASDPRREIILPRHRP